MDNLRESMAMKIAAIVHDLSRPTCIRKYGNTNGKYQELESEAVIRSFLEEYHLDPIDEDRIVYMVSRHHTYMGVEGDDLQILLEADFLVNSQEKQMDLENVRVFRKNVYKTKPVRHC